MINHCNRKTYTYPWSVFQNKNVEHMKLSYEIIGSSIKYFNTTYVFIYIINIQ